MQKIIRTNETEYCLPCSVCGETAVVFEIGIPRFGKEEKNLIYSGITHGTALGLQHVQNIFNYLEKEEIANVHNYLIKEKLNFEGIDGYCPDCDKIYCRFHYNAYEEYDEGFYDCTYGVCPKGHKRMIDD